MSNSLDKCKLIELPKVSETRGNLSFVEGGQHVPFDIQRVYYLYGVPPTAERGGHAHKALHQLLIAVAGGFDIVLDDGCQKRRVRLDRPNHGLYICPMIWRELKGFSLGALCLVLASNHYNESDYLRSYRSFTAAKAES